MNHYSDSDKAYALQVLAQTNGNLSKTAEITGYPRKTIEYWARQTGVRGVVAQRELSGVEGSVEGAISATIGEQNEPVRRMGTEQDRQDAIGGWQRARDLNLRELTDEAKVKKASLLHNNIAAGTAQDKLNILTGGPTARFEHVRVRLVGPDGTSVDDGDEPLPSGSLIAGDLLRRMAGRVIDVQSLPPGKMPERTKPRERGASIPASGDKLS